MEFEALAGLAVIFFGVMTLTIVGATTVAIILGIAWFSGARILVAAVSLVIGIGWLANGCLNGSLPKLVLTLWFSYRTAPLSAAWIIWFSTWSNALAWKTLPCLALIASAVALFLSEDRANSPVRRLIEGGHGNTPVAPWTKLLVNRRLKRAPATKDAWLGVERRTGKIVAIPQSSMQKHAIAVGRSGTGKTTTLLNLLHWGIQNNFPVTVVNGKGDPDFGDRLQHLAQRHGRPFFRADMRSEQPNACYAPLANKNFSVKADLIVGLREIYSEEHYRLLQTEHAQTTFRVLDQLGIDVDLASLPDFMSSDRLLLELRRSSRRGNYQELADAVIALEAAEKAGIDSLRASVKNLVNSSYRPLFDTKAAKTTGKAVFDLHSARAAGAVTYFGIPSLLLPTSAKCLTTLIVNDIKATLSQGSKPWLICFDELASVGPGITNIINQGRSYGAMCILGCQSFADMKLPADPNFVDRVVGSVNCFIFHEMSVPDDIDVASSIIGTLPLIEVTAQLQGWASTPTGAASARAVHEFKIRPDLLRAGRVGEAYVLDKDRRKVFGPVRITKHS